MSSQTNRRTFLKSSAVATTGFWVAGGVAKAQSRSPNEKLNIASVGAGGRASSDIGACKDENIVALCDVSDRRAARTYGRYENAGEMPAGAQIAKDSFIVTTGGDIITGSFFLMEKMPKGWNPATGDWRYVEFKADGSLTGMTKGIRANQVRFCASCHARVGKKQDSLFFMPKDVRVVE